MSCRHSSSLHVASWHGLFLILEVLFLLQVKKELETNGIEFYPQKEFDDDMEDKSDNDKIRVTFFLSQV